MVSPFPFWGPPPRGFFPPFNVFSGFGICWGGKLGGGINKFSPPEKQVWDPGFRPRAGKLTLHKGGPKGGSFHRRWRPALEIVDPPWFGPWLSLTAARFFFFFFFFFF
eukprot:FR738312.1.p2 GENE.FR738312.1~~FR738312.1.p2  ORF type:complete len:108 (-),score=57.75 FR738312.1:888-1211(-)